MLRIQRTDLFLVAFCFTVMDWLLVSTSMTTAFLLGREVTTTTIITKWNFADGKYNRQRGSLSNKRRTHHHQRKMALGDFTVELEKPLGIILEEIDENGQGGGVKVKELVEGGAAESLSPIVPGDVLLEVGSTDVSDSDFDSVMDSLVDSPSPVSLKLGDGLGIMDMPKNVVKGLKTTEDAYFVDAVVRQAVREIRRNGKKLGDLLNVEVIIGAGVQEQEQGKKTLGLVRFFAIFSTDGVSTYSCNVSATGERSDDGEEDNIKIVSLSCAKDEGLGQTYDLI